MQSGVPLTVSGGNSSLLTARTNDKAETTSEAARVTWLFLAGVGSSSRRKNGLRFRTTGLSKFKYESYPVNDQYLLSLSDIYDLQNCSI
jgi:hypothetical protein